MFHGCICSCNNYCIIEYKSIKHFTVKEKGVSDTSIFKMSVLTVFCEHKCIKNNQILPHLLLFYWFDQTCWATRKMTALWTQLSTSEHRKWAASDLITYPEGLLSYGSTPLSESQEMLSQLAHKLLVGLYFFGSFESQCDTENKFSVRNNHLWSSVTPEKYRH